MKYVSLLILGSMLGGAAALAGPQVEDQGPLSPCAQSIGEAGSNPASDQSAQAWGVVISTAMAEFDRIKQDHNDVLGNYDAIVVATCDLHMGTKLQYSARIGMDSREDAESLCDKLKAAGGACIVQKN
jgi:hypothetical protein